MLHFKKIDFSDYTSKNTMKDIVVSLTILIPLLLVYPSFLEYIESRQGISFTDPLLSLFTPVDLTYPIFILLYASLFIGIVNLIANPNDLALAIRTYAFMIIFRMSAMYLLPLSAPVSMIPLSDPFVELFSSGNTLTNDLFFSGHTATMLVLFFTVQSKKLKRFFLAGTVLLVLCVLAQHVHYSIDVLAAIPFTYLAFRISIISNITHHNNSAKLSK